jgi:hypothetical protein
MANLDMEVGKNPFPHFGNSEDGIIEDAIATLPCSTRFNEAIPAGRQQWLATLAAHAFFESHFAAKHDERLAHALFLEETFQSEISEIQFTAARRPL